MDYLSVVCLIFISVTMINFNRKTSNFIDVRNIFKHYFKMFNSNIFQIIVIYVFPIFFAIWISERQLLTKEIIDDINLIVTIFTSMFFAIISILCSININANNESYKRLVRETFNATLFEIICCLVMLIILFIGISFKKSTDIFKYIGSNVVYYLFIIIIFNILIIIKRFKNIFEGNSNINKE